MGTFPGGKSFAFSVFDDTDRGTVANVGPVYRMLARLGIRTTKSVWPLPNSPEGRIPGETLADKPYLEFCQWLQSEGFEIASHNARNYHATRDVTQEGLQRFADCLGHPPRTHCNHLNNRENIYWGKHRFRFPWHRLIYSSLMRLRKRSGTYEGHVEDSPCFWGDLCRDQVDYVRNWVFDEVNLDKVNPTMPYQDPRTPYVKAWFSSCEGSALEVFCDKISDRNLDRLEAEGGVCIMYTHFGKRFADGDGVHKDFQERMTCLSKRNGWFVPVAELLDFLKTRRKSAVISSRELYRMECRWFADKLKGKLST